VPLVEGFAHPPIIDVGTRTMAMMTE
jgi:hypothetical protein